MKIITRKEAISLGLIRYFTGKPCSKGHIDERQTKKGICCQCNRDASSNAWKQGKRWSQKDKTRATECVKRWTANHPKQKSEKNRKWREENRAEHNAHAAKRRAIKLQRTPAWADKKEISMWYEAAEILSRGGVSFHVDHIVPLQGKEVCGFHSQDNLQLLPWYKNLQKSAKLKDKNIG